MLIAALGTEKLKHHKVVIIGGLYRSLLWDIWRFYYQTTVGSLG